MPGGARSSPGKGFLDPERLGQGSPSGTKIVFDERAENPRDVEGEGRLGS